MSTKDGGPAFPRQLKITGSCSGSTTKARADARREKG